MDAYALALAVFGLGSLACGLAGDSGFLTGLHAVALGSAVLYLMTAGLLLRPPGTDRRWQ